MCVYALVLPDQASQRYACQRSHLNSICNTACQHSAPGKAVDAHIMIQEPASLPDFDRPQCCSSVCQKQDPCCDTDSTWACKHHSWLGTWKVQGLLTLHTRKEQPKLCMHKTSQAACHLVLDLASDKDRVMQLAFTCSRCCCGIYHAITIVLMVIAKANLACTLPSAAQQLMSLPDKMMSLTC